MSPYSAALATARAVAQDQDYPSGALYVVATPIGNLADISLRALHVLGLVDAIACEDTRHTGALLRAYGIEARSLLAVHEHNEVQAAQGVVARLQAGERVAYVSDAGTPGISDPGARLVAAVQAAGLRSVPLPGASAVTTLLSVAGLASEPAGFCFVGFLPTAAAARERALAVLAAEARCCVLLEAPHRIEALARALAPLGVRALTVGRELTKQYEEVATLAVADFPDWLAALPQRTRGEFVLALHPLPTQTALTVDTRVLELLLAHLPLKTAVALAAEIDGAPRNALYRAALDLKQSG